MGTVTVEFPNARHEEDSFALPEGFSLALPGPREDDTGGVRKLVPNRDSDMRVPGIIGKSFDYAPGTRESTNVETRGAPESAGWMSIFKDDGNYDTSGFTIPKGFKIENEGDWSAEVIEPMVKDEGPRYPFEYHPEEILQGRNARTYNYAPQDEGWRGSTPRKGEAHDISFDLPEGFTIDSSSMGMTGLSDMGDAPSAQLGVPGKTGGSGKGITEGAVFRENPDGSVTFKPSDSLIRFMTSKDPKDQERAAWEIATTLASGGFARGAIASKGTLGAVDELGIFGGKNATSPPPKDSPAGIWTVASDGQPRFEISDHNMKWKTKFWDQFKSSGLSKFIDHPELFKQYPDLNTIKLQISDSLGKGNAVFDEKGWRLFMSEADIGTPEGLSIMVHELQHAVQKLEGFARGGSPTTSERDVRSVYSLVKKSEINEEGLKALDNMEGPDKSYILKTLHALARAIDHFDPGAYDMRTLEGVLMAIRELPQPNRDRVFADAALRHYFQLAGEVEARNAQKRINAPPITRQFWDPEKSEDAPRLLQINKFDASDDVRVVEGPKVVKGGTEVVKENVDELHNNLVKALKTGSPVDIKAAKKNIDALRKTAQGIMKESEDLLPPLRKEDADAMGMTMEQYKWYMLEDITLEIDMGTRATFETIIGGKHPDKEVTASNIVEWLQDAGIPKENIKVQKKGKDKTQYITFKDPANPTSLSFGGNTKIRLPKLDKHGAGHAGYDAAPRARGGGIIDTANREYAEGLPLDPYTTSNISNASFSKWGNLIDALKWRLSRSPDGNFLISPGNEPKPKPIAARQEGTGSVISRDPNQLELPLGGPQRPLYGPDNYDFWNLKGDDFKRALHEYRMNKTAMPTRVLTPEEAKRLLDATILLPKDET